MYVLIKMCYVRLKDKSNIKRVNDSNAANRKILGIFRYFSVNLNWAKTKHNILICEDCCSKLLELYQFAKMCNKNSIILQDYVSLLNEAGSSNEHVEAHLSVLLVGQSGMNYKVELKTEEDAIIDLKNAEYVTKSLEFDIKVEKKEKTDAEIVLDSHILSEPKSESTTMASGDSGAEYSADDGPTEVTTDNVTSRFRCEEIDVADPSVLTEYMNDIIYKVKLVTQEDALTDSRQITTEVTETLDYEIHIKEDVICKSEELDEEYTEIFNEETDSDISQDYEEIIYNSVGGFIGFTYQEIGAAKEHSVIIINKEVTNYETLYTRTKSQLHQHNLIHTNEEYYYKCTICNKHYRTKRALSAHKRIHSGKRFVCSFCSKEFNLKSNLIGHIRTHTGEKPYKCSFCNKFFGSTSNLKVHEVIHTNLKPHKCSVCNKQFNQKNDLIIHTHTYW